jgi:predicted GIY-YIG superfamily endonuclease
MPYFPVDDDMSFHPKVLAADLPPWESDPALIDVSRRFSVAWLIGSDFDDAECFVYEVFERDVETGFAQEHPVYVGITRNFPARWGEHRRASWWFFYVKPACILLSGYLTRADALKVEAQLIAEHRPRFNTKEERRHLAWAQAQPPRPRLFTAELVGRH